MERRFVILVTSTGSNLPVIANRVGDMSAMIRLRWATRPEWWGNGGEGSWFGISRLLSSP